MQYTLQQTINWALTFIQYSPLTAGLGQEPAVTLASEIRSTILSAPFTWAFNRNEVTVTLAKGVQDYTQAIADFGFLEKTSLVDSQGKTFEMKNVMNTEALAVTAVQQRPDSISVLTRTGSSIKLRFYGSPDQAYTATLTYQKLSPIMGPFFSNAATAAVAGNTTYAGMYDVDAFPTGSVASITGFSNAANNGMFVVVSVTPTTLVVANAAGVLQTAQSGYVSNFSWAPLPDNYNYIYNALFLGEALAMVDDPRAMQYRTRGVGALLAKADGLSAMQKNIFMQQWIANGLEGARAGLRMQQATQGRST